MENSSVMLCVPAQPSFARSVRMTAANLAVLCPMNVEEVEDVRMAAEEAFVYACATRPENCMITFDISDDGLHMEFSLGGAIDMANTALMEQAGLARVLLSAVSDSHEFSADGSTLLVTKLVGGTYGE